MTHENEKSQTNTNILLNSKRSPLKLESDGGGEWYISLFQNFLKVNYIQH